MSSLHRTRPSHHPSLRYSTTIHSPVSVHPALFVIMHLIARRSLPIPAHPLHAENQKRIELTHHPSPGICDLRTPSCSCSRPPTASRSSVSTTSHPPDEVRYVSTTRISPDNYPLFTPPLRPRTPLLLALQRALYTQPFYLPCAHRTSLSHICVYCIYLARRSLSVCGCTRGVVMVRALLFG